MTSRYDCECGLNLHHSSYVKHIKSEKHEKLMEFQNKLKNEIIKLKKENEILKKTIKNIS